MKTKTRIFIALGLISAMVIGFLIGINVNYPSVNSNYTTGTIGKINNYRNIKLSDADLKIHNNLISDTARVRQIKNYYNFYYLNALQMSVIIDGAIKEANSAIKFKEKNQIIIDELARYETFLSSARTDLLLALSALNSSKDLDPSLFMILTSQANNVVVQINYKNKYIVRFIDDVDAYVKENPSTDCGGLKKYHDILATKEAFNAAMTGDKVLLKYFDKKPLFGKKEDMQLNFQNQLDILMQNDVKILNLNAGQDKKALLVICSTDRLNTTLLDVKSLNYFYDSEVLGSYDVERLGMLPISDAERLGYIPMD